MRSASVPPFALRVALVGASTSLASPVLAVVGAVVGWRRLISAYGRGVTLTSTILLGGGIVRLVLEYLVPFVAQHGDLIAPFALANGLAASVCYAGLEAHFGLSGMVAQANVAAWGSRLMGGSPLLGNMPLMVPIGGVAVGLLTGALAPFLWPLTIRVCWPEELRMAALRDGTTFQLIDLYFSWCLPVAVPVSLLAGYALHIALASTLTGSATSLPWQQSALPLFVGLSLAGLSYFLLCVPALSECFWSERLDAQTGEAYSFNLRTGARTSSIEAALHASETRALLSVLHEIQVPVLGRLRKAWWQSNRSQDEPAGKAALAPLTPPFGMRSNGGQPDLRLIDASPQADLTLLIDMLARAQVLRIDLAIARGTDGSHDQEELAMLRLNSLSSMAASRLGVDLDVLLSDVRAIIGARRRLERYSTAATSSRSSRGVRARQAAERQHTRELLSRMRAHAKTAALARHYVEETGTTWWARGWADAWGTNSQQRLAAGQLLSNLLHNIGIVEDVLLNVRPFVALSKEKKLGVGEDWWNDFDLDVDAFLQARAKEEVLKRHQERVRRMKEVLLRTTRLVATAFVLWLVTLSWHN